MSLKYCYYILCAFALTLVSCDDDPVLFKDPVSALSNDCIKRSLPIAPNIVGENIEFAYAMAIPKSLGVLKSAQVVASIAGATSTYIDPNSYYTNSSGVDVPVAVAGVSTNSGTSTSTSFVVDTCASTLRYYYVIPEEARDKEVSFVFSCTSSNGQTAQYKMGPYKISRMDMTLQQNLSSDNCYISFQDQSAAMKIYSKDDLSADPSLASKIDIVYNYSTKKDFTHSFYTPSSPVEYMDGTVLPSGYTNNTKMLKIYGLRDRQLADLQYSNFIDDLDFQKLDMTKNTNYILNLKEESGVWVETADGQYRAFIFVNKAPTGSMIISAKRYKM